MVLEKDKMFNNQKAIQSMDARNILYLLIFIGWPNVLVITLSKDKVINILATMFCSYLCPITISCLLYVLMICIKKRHFLSKVEATPKVSDTNIQNNIAACFNSNTSSDENEVPNQEITNHLEMKDKTQGFQTASVHKLTDSTKADSTNFLQDPINSSDAEEVMYII